jgi:hypothetical protein
MSNDRSHRWFHALVVTGAAITACGGSSSDDSDASSDASSSPDATLVDGASSGTDGRIVIVLDAGNGDAADARDDPRCCTITN